MNGILRRGTVVNGYLRDFTWTCFEWTVANAIWTQFERVSCHERSRTENPLAVEISTEGVEYVHSWISDSKDGPYQVINNLLISRRCHQHVCVYVWLLSACLCSKLGTPLWMAVTHFHHRFHSRCVPAFVPQVPPLLPPFQSQQPNY